MSSCPWCQVCPHRHHPAYINFPGEHREENPTSNDTHTPPFQARQFPDLEKINELGQINLRPDEESRLESYGHPNALRHTAQLYVDAENYAFQAIKYRSRVEYFKTFVWAVTILAAWAYFLWALENHDLAGLVGLDPNTLLAFTWVLLFLCLLMLCAVR